MALIALVAALSFTATPSALTLTGDGGSGAELEVRGRPGQKITLSSSVGLVGPVREEAGVYRAHFTPPVLPAPTVALLLAVAEDGPARELAWLSLPLSGSEVMPLETRPGATVLAEIGGRTFGPVVADRKGTAKLPVVVAPGVSIALLRITDKLGNHSDKPLDLDPPPFARLRLAARAEAATSGSPLQVEVFVIRPDGSPDEAAKISLSADRGEVEPARSLGAGRYLANYHAPSGEPAGTAILQAKSGGQLSRLEVPLRRAEATLGQPFWPSTLATQKPWSRSLGLLAGAGAGFDGGAAGSVLGQFALRLEVLPLEALVEVGGSTFSTVAQGNGERAQANDLQLNLGARLGYQLARNVDGFVALLFGFTHQTVHTTLASGQALDLSEGGPRAALSLGATLRLGPGRLLAQLQADSSPGGMARLRGSTSALQLFAGYLFDLP